MAADRISKIGKMRLWKSCFLRPGSESMLKFGTAVAALLVSIQPAIADLCNCQKECANRERPNAGLTYEDEEHRLWYEVRFWTGECKGKIWLTCWSGPSWYDVMDKVLASGAPDARPQMCERLFTLGVRIGHEWARDNAIRLIHTEDLDRWQTRLLDSDDPVRAIGELEALVESRLK
jgi:hypothetical protein